MASSTLPDQTTNPTVPKQTYFTRFNIWHRLEHLSLAGRDLSRLRQTFGAQHVPGDQ